jgi:hypothetical protein
MGDAIKLSPEKLEFIGGNERTKGFEPNSPERQANKTTELRSSSSAAASVEPTEVSGARHRRPRQRATEYVPNVDEVLNEVLVPLPTRIPHHLSQTLRRFCLEQKLKHAKPDSIQEVVETALEEWLSKRVR